MHAHYNDNEAYRQNDEPYKMTISFRNMLKRLTGFRRTNLILGISQ